MFEVNYRFQEIPLFQDPELEDYSLGKYGIIAQISETHPDLCSFQDASRTAVNYSKQLDHSDVYRHMCLLPSAEQILFQRAALPDWIEQVVGSSSYDSLEGLKAYLQGLGLTDIECDAATTLLAPLHTRSFVGVFQDKKKGLCAFVGHTPYVGENPLALSIYSNFPQKFFGKGKRLGRFVSIPKGHELGRDALRCLTTGTTVFELDSYPLDSKLTLGDFEDSLIQELHGGVEATETYVDRFLERKLGSLGVSELDFKLGFLLKGLEVSPNQLVVLPLQLNGTHIDVASLDDLAYFRPFYCTGDLGFVEDRLEFKRRHFRVEPRNKMGSDKRKKARAKRKKKKKKR